MVGKVEVDGQRICNADGSDYELDDSGVFIRLGLTVAMTP